MSRSALAVAAGLLALSLPCAVAAQDLRGGGGSSLRSDSYRNPGEARWQAERALRRLSGDTSIEAMRQERALREIERDAARELRRREARGRREAPAEAGLRAPAELLPPYPVDLRGRDVLLGTAKLFIRVGRLLDRADGLTAGGSSAAARPLIGEAAELLGQAAAAPGVPADDPNLVALTRQLEAARARASAGS